jgi:probable HAF family extracellular repeat protein
MRSIGLLLSLAVGLANASELLQGNFSFTYLSGLGSPFGLNDNGAIVGGVGGEQSQGFLYTNGIVTPLNVPGSTQTIAYGINNSEEVVGSAVSAGTAPYGFLYSAGIFSPIAVPGATATSAQGVNSAGQVVGYFTTASGNRNGFLYSDGAFQSIAVPGAISTYVRGINDTGEMCGYISFSDGLESAFVYLNGALTILNVPGASNTEAFGINDAGEVVGAFIDASGTHGFVEQDLVYMTIDDPETPSTVGTFAWDINNNGEISGSGTTAFVAVAAPEPSTFVLLALGAAALLCRKGFR